MESDHPSPFGDSTLLSRMVREPVVHFLLIALFLLAVERIRKPPQLPQHRVVVSAQDVQRMGEDYRRRTGIVSTPEALSGLVTQFVDEEVLYREALRLELARGDALVRRRLIQKIELLAEDAATGAPVSTAEAQAYVEAHRDVFMQPSRVTVQHVFFSQSVHGARTKEVASHALSGLKRLKESEAMPRIGDAFPHGQRFAGKTAKDLEAMFGAAFARAVEAASVGQWVGPVASTFGEHLVFVESVSPARMPSLGEVTAQVEAAIHRERAESGRRKFIQQLRERYVIDVAPVVSGESTR